MKYLYNKMLLLVFLLSPLGLFSQGTATINSSLCVSINTTSPVQEYYEIDFAHLNILSELDATERFGFICNNLLTYEVDYATNKVMLHLHLDRTPVPKDIIWWNDYIISLCGT